MDASYRKCKIIKVCPYRATTPTSAGEMGLADKNHGWVVDTIKGDLAELMNESAPLPSPDKPVFFRSIGLGLEDIADAADLLTLVKERG